ncbi:MAG: amidohydrolase [Acidobacteria bacterium]|nr:MAG: amidohydrolase [Acidobacteriota bacterium]PYT88358.1 MAG: amidohydrolase [Acidobacteriota bacterium]
MKLALRVCWPGSDRGRSRRTMKTVVAVLLGVGAAIAATNASAQSASAPEQAGPFGSLEIRDVTVIDGSGAPAFGPVNIYIKGNRIERVVSVDAIARERREEEGTGAKEKETRRPDRVIEGKGMYVMPGLVDVHIHINESKDVPADYIYKLLLGHGVTTIRTFNVGRNDPKGMVAEKKKIAANQIIAPRMYVYPFWGRDNDPRNSQADGARQIVDEWHALGVDGIKIIGKPGLWPDVFHAIADEARKNGMGVAVHIAQDGVYPMNAVNAASEGASTIEHHYGYPESSFTTQTIQNLPPSYNYANEPDRFLETGRAWLQADGERLHGEVIQSLLATMRKTGFIMVPTFSIYEANRDVTRAANLPWHSTFTLPAVMDTFLPNPAHHASYFYEWTSNKEADWARAYRRWMEFVNDYKNQGGVVAVGSDTGFLFSLWGFGTIRELEMLEEAGFSPLEALHAATENGAKVVKNPELGLVRPGYLADLVVLTENPLEDMKVFYGNGVTRVSADRKEVHEQCVKYTIRDGVIFDAQALLGDVRGMVSKAKQPLPPNKP